MPILLLIPVIAYGVRTHGVISSRFDEQEVAERSKDVTVCLSTLEARKQLLQRVEWADAAAWGPSPAQSSVVGPANIHNQPSTSSIADSYLLADGDGRVLRSNHLDSSLVKFLRHSRRLREAARGHSRCGLVAAGGSVYLVAAGPVSVSAANGSGHGALCVVDRIDSGLLGDVGKASGCSPAVFSSDGKLVAVASGAGEAGSHFADSSQIATTLAVDFTVIRVGHGGHHIYASQRLADWDGNFVGVLATSTSRDMVLSSRRISALLTLLFVAISIGLGVLGVLQIRARMLLRGAMVDEVTGLYNHRFMQERLASEVSRCQRYSRPLAVAMIDIDHFKDVNDTFGHQVGDQALKHLSRMLLQSVRSTDIVARYGGEEFLIIMTETDLQSALSVSERIREDVEASGFDAKTQRVGGSGSEGLVKFTVSIGVAAFPEHAEKPNDIIMAADLALFAAKRASRNAVMSYDVIAGEASGKRASPRSIHLSMREGSLSSIRALAAAIDARDHRMRGHSEKVTLCSLAIGEAMGLNNEEMNRLRTAGLLHDVGRIAIPDSVLGKPGELTMEERSLVAAHSEVGAGILSKAPQLQSVAEIVRRHHEHYDGTGYPGGLSGEDIPLLARIIAVADAFDAMTSDRPHRAGATAVSVVKKMMKSSGKQFDPEVIAALERLVSSGRLFDIFASFQEDLRVAA